MGSGLDTSISAHQLLHINSWHFLLFAAVSVVVLRLVWRGWGKRLALLALNLYFLSFCIAGVSSIVFLAVLLAATYLLGELTVRRRDHLPAAIMVFIAIAMWVLLFLAKDPALIPIANPFHYFPVRLVGISYIVFRCMQYVLDAEVFEQRHPITLVNFVLFFPTLLAGPIERYENFQQFHDDEVIQRDASVLPALHRIANGVIKKYVFADNLMVFGIFSMPDGEPWSVPLIWIGVLAQLALLYLDFSGYCDIVIGIARLFGFKLAENFDRPWRAHNIQDFWNRWHITLSRFIRDYVFTPLNHTIARSVPRSRQFPLVLATYFLTMMLIALWHGTTWGFFVFGLLHAGALVGHLMLRRFVYPRLGARTRAFIEDSPVALYASRCSTYTFICLTMVFWYKGVEATLDIFLMMIGVQP